MLKLAPLWVRVDENRVKISVFVVLFVIGSALLLVAAFVGVPGFMIGWGGSLAGEWAMDWYLPRFALALGIALVAMLLLGSIAAAVQLGNAEHWVANRFQGRELTADENQQFASAVHDMSLAAGLAQPPRLMVLEAPGVNAFALGTTRARPLIGVTSRFLTTLTPAEQRAVAATLIARICAGDIMFGTALAALMGPLKAIRESRAALAEGGQGCLSVDPGVADGCATDGCGDGCGCLFDGLSDSDSAAGCLPMIAMVLFVIITVALTYAAVLSAAWVVTLWGRALHRTAYEKADAEGMLLLKDPVAMKSALERCIAESNEVTPGDDPSYDGIFYVATSGRPGVDARERRRHARLMQVLGVDGLMADAK